MKDIRKTNRLYKTLAVVVAAVLLLGGVFSPKAFLGPGISNVAGLTAIDHVSATDVVSPLPDAETTAITSSQVHNLLGIIKVTQSSMRTLNFDVGVNASYSSSTYWWSYDYANLLTPSNMTIDPHPETDGVIEFHLNVSTGIPVNTPLLYCYFNSYDTISHAMISIYKDVNYGDKVGGLGYTGDIESTVSLEVIHVGDADLDGEVGASDAQLALRIFAETAELDADTEEKQRLAADVNRDGLVNAADALQILQYTTDDAVSLWDERRVALPTTEAENPVADTLVSGMVYRLRNVSTGQYLSVSETNSTLAGVTTDYNPKEQYAKFELRKAANQPYYMLINQSNGTTLRLDNNYQVNFDNSAGGYIANSGYWYIVPGQGGYELVSYPARDRALTTYGYVKSGSEDCKADYAARGTVWAFEVPPITISYHYDGGYNSRYGASGVANLNTYQQKIGTILETTFNADVTLENNLGAVTPSYADTCTNGINTNCVHSTDDDCLDNCTTYPYTGGHHKNTEALLLKWYRSIPTNEQSKIHITYSGHLQCAVSDEDGNGIIDTHKRAGLNGATYPDYGVAVVYSNGLGNRDYKERLTALHEISHDLGADHCSDALCVMNPNRHNETLKEYFDANTQSYDMYCDTCYATIVTYLARNY